MSRLVKEAWTIGQRAQLDPTLILAIMVQHLPREQQKKALFYGLVGAFVLRLGAILVASQLSTLWWIQLIGALYLIWMPIKHFVKSQSDAEHKGAGGASFWMTVILADLADLAFQRSRLLLKNSANLPTGLT